MTWLTRGIAISKAILKYEALSDYVFTYENAPPTSVVFQYDYSKMSGASMAEPFRLHPNLIMGNSIRRNPYCVNSDDYLRMLRRMDGERRTQPLWRERV